MFTFFKDKEKCLSIRHREQDIELILMLNMSAGHKDWNYSRYKIYRVTENSPELEVLRHGFVKRTSGS